MSVKTIKSSAAHSTIKNVFFNADQFELTDDDIEEIISENTQIAAANFSEWAKVANESKGR